MHCFVCSDHRELELCPAPASVGEGRESLSTACSPSLIYQRNQLELEGRASNREWVHPFHCVCAFLYCKCICNNFHQPVWEEVSFLYTVPIG